MFENWLSTNPKIKLSPKMHELLIGVWHDRLNPKAIVITYLATRNFGVVRFPTRPDRSVDGKGHGYSDAVALLDSFTDSELDGLAAELRSISSTTQQVLRTINPTGLIKLERALAPMSTTQYLAANRECDQIELFPMLALAAQKASQPSICLDIDIVSGWSTTSLQRYGTLHITRDWEIGDILLVSDILDGPLESNEWLCVNTNPRGLVEFPASNFKVIGLPQEFMEKVSNHPSGVELVKELQKKAHLAPTERGIALRPSPFWIRKGVPTYKPTWVDKLRYIFAPVCRCQGCRTLRAGN